MLTDNQTNKVYLSRKLKEEHKIITSCVTNALNSTSTPWAWLEHTNDFWCRDYMPIQVAEKKFIQYEYSPDYLVKKGLNEYITNPTQTLESLGIETIKTNIILDGGNVIKCKDCVIMVDKVFKENPDRRPADLISELERLFEAEIIFLPWDKYETYGHADGIVRYISDHKVLMTNYHDYDPKISEKFQKILSQKFDLQILEYPRKTFAKNWAYINFLQTDTHIFLPSFDKEEDLQALNQITKHYPAYKDHITPIPFTTIVNKGGALNCTTWNIKA